MMINPMLGAMSLLSAGLVLWQWRASLRFPLRQRGVPRQPSQGISILKPLKGSDRYTSECLESWLEQDYPGPVEFLFGVDSETDPACEVVNALMARFPRRPAKLVVCGPPEGANAKASKLAQLAARAVHKHLVISDADVKAPPDLLLELERGFDGEGVGMVSCFYAMAMPNTLAMRWEAVAINADFWSQVLQRRDLGPLDFALGAVMSVSQPCLNEIGGFGSLANCLADDYLLGHRIAQRGYRVQLCSVPVECWSDPMNWREAWQHQLRWARTIRVCQPIPYALSLLNNATLWTGAWWISHPSLERTVLAAILLGFRAVTAMDLQRRLAPAWFSWSFFWMVWIKDILQTLIWALAFLGNTVHWRGCNYRVRPDGTLEVAEK